MTDLQRHGRVFVRSIPAALLALGVISVTGAAPVSANNDPHRSVVPSGPVDLPAGICAFPVHIEFPVNREYQTVSSLPDGSTVSVVTGSLTATFTNVITGRSVSANVSGPGTTTFSPDGSTAHYDVRGLFNFAFSNATNFGFPSGLFVTSGQWAFDYNFATFAMSAPSRHPAVLRDLCAELTS